MKNKKGNRKQGKKVTKKVTKKEVKKVKLGKKQKRALNKAIKDTIFQMFFDARKTKKTIPSCQVVFEVINEKYPGTMCQKNIKSHYSYYKTRWNEILKWSQELSK